jgi:hypothetical protein
MNNSPTLSLLDEKNLEFQKELTSLLNRYGKDSECNTQDFVLSDFLIRQMYSLASAVTWRDTLKGYTK